MTKRKHDKNKKANINWGTKTKKEEKNIAKEKRNKAKPKNKNHRKKNLNQISE